MNEKDLIEKARRIIRFSSEHHNLFKINDDKFAERFDFYRLLIYLPKDWTNYFSCNVIEQQLRSVGWCVIKNEDQFHDFWLQSNELTDEEAKQYLGGGPHFKYYGSFADEEKIDCVGSIEQLNDESLHYQMLIVGMINRIGFESIFANSRNQYDENNIDEMLLDFMEKLIDNYSDSLTQEQINGIRNHVYTHINSNQDLVADHKRFTK